MVNYEESKLLMSQPRVVVRGGGECIITPRHGWTAQPRPVILPPVRARLSSHGEWDTGSELRTWVAPQPHWHTVRPRGASHWDLSAGWQYEEWCHCSGRWYSSPAPTHTGPVCQCTSVPHWWPARTSPSNFANCRLGILPANSSLWGRREPAGLVLL